MRPFSISSILIYLFSGYVLWVTYVIYTFLYPSECASKNDHLCINPAFKKGDAFQLFLCTSLDSHPLAKKLTVIYHNSSFDLAQPLTVELQVAVPGSTRNNGTLYLHVILTKLQTIVQPTATVLQSKHTVASVAYLTKYQVPSPGKVFHLFHTDDAIDKNDSSRRREASHWKGKGLQPVTHWKSRFVINSIGWPFSIDRANLPYEMLHLMQLDSRHRYMPVVYLSDVRQRAQHVLPIDQDGTELMPLHILYEPLTVGQLRFMLILEKSFRSIRQFGFGDKEIEDAKGIFFETNHIMLLATVMIVSFHALFDFLAFKNDIQFWRHRRTMEGLSLNTIIWRFASTVIISLYLVDRKTSVLVTAPCIISALIELWKMKKLLRIEWRGWRLVKATSYQATQLEAKTSQIDSALLSILNYYVLPPLLLGGAVYSILYVQHESLYSWVLESLVNGVYAFGFIAMLPQLFINYKLKSVAHLPWRAFMYKAFNTFIDDFFAFLVPSVPTSHRLATFRDDIIFLIYLYQRWLYPIDKSRTIEASFADQSLEPTESKKDQ